jgi:signal transduction histidine kinase
VEARRDGELLKILVEDDGHGGANLDTGTGLRGLQDRLAVLGGSLEVTSAGGTRLKATIPL